LKLPQKFYTAITCDVKSYLSHMLANQFTLRLENSVVKPYTNFLYGHLL